MLLSQDSRPAEKLGDTRTAVNSSCQLVHGMFVCMLCFAAVILKKKRSTFYVIIVIKVLLSKSILIQTVFTPILFWNLFQKLQIDMISK